MNRTLSGGRTSVVLVGCLTLALLAGWMLYPAPRSLPPTATGDADLISRVRDATGDRGNHLAVAVVTTEGTRTAEIGAGAGDRFEIGSITKTMTGQLLAIAIDKGEVRADDQLNRYLPELGETPIGRVSLLQAATHTGGIPSLVSDPAVVATGLLANLTADNPYRQTLPQTISSASRMAADRPPHTYSNLAFTLLGSALAVAAGTDYRDLVRERVWQPLGMADTIVAYSNDDLGSHDLLGQTAGRRTADPWTGEAIAPAGGARSNLGDMTRYAAALLSNDMPGNDATRVRARETDSRGTGLAWVTSRISGHMITWHNGQTGGFSSFVGVDRDRGVAVLVLSATTDQADRLAADLIGQEWHR